MFLAAALVVMSFPQTASAMPSEAKNSETTVDSAKTAFVNEDANALPAAPAPKVTADVVSDASAESSSLNAVAYQPGEPIKPANPPKFAARHHEESRKQRAIWLGLGAAGHGAAAFDAYWTRQAISGGYGTEANPMLRPFAHSGAIYAATQVSPTVMDFIGHKMMTSRSPLMRKMWWVPQVAGAGLSFTAGMHNRSLVK